MLPGWPLLSWSGTLHGWIFGAFSSLWLRSARRRARTVLARLLAAADLPGGPWRVLDQRTWRTGTIGSPTLWGDRARQAGSVTAWRSFRDAGAERWAWIQIAPLASAGDAESALSGVGDRRLATPARAYGW
jgi:hypothetical protein